MKNQHTIKSYSIGFGLSILLTLTAYLVVVNEVYSGWFLIAAVISLAIAQLFVQLIFFLHLLEESKPRWNLFIVLSTILIILIIVGGSLWIMNNLDYRHMLSPANTTNYILKGEGINK